MSQHDDLILLRDMLDHAREAVTLMAGHTRESLATERVLQLAITRLIEIVGEAASRVSEQGQKRYPNLPWAPMIGMRNRIVHAYGTISLDRIWDTIIEDLPQLITALEEILGPA